MEFGPEKHQLSAVLFGMFFIKKQNLTNDNITEMIKKIEHISISNVDPKDDAQIKKKF